MTGERMARRRPTARLAVHTSQDGLRRTVHSGALAPPVWFERDAPERNPSREIAPDFALVALLPHAMKAGFDLEPDFAVDRMLLEGLEHFQEVWHRWRPDVFAEKIAIRAEPVERSDAALPARRKVVAAFSAGVDSSFTLLRHAGGIEWPGRRNLVSAVMVHGFDMPLDATEGFGRLRSHGEAIAREMDVDFFVMRTNWRETAPNWQMSFGAGLAAVLHQFSGEHETGLIASEEAYDNAFTVWGNSFWNDRFYSRSDFRIESDGGAYDRSDRIAALSSRPAIVCELSVCWAGPRTGENCGLCPKCVLTKLNFTIAGIQEPWPFPQELTPEQVSAMPVKTQWQARFLAIIERRLKTLPNHDPVLLESVRNRMTRAAAEDGYGDASTLPAEYRKKALWKRRSEHLLQRIKGILRSRR